MLKESLELSLSSLKHRKISSTLTVLGIVIGISAIIGLVSIGAGLEKSVSEQLESLGSDMIIVMPGATGEMIATSFFGEGLTQDDVETIEGISGVESAAGILMKTLPVKYKKETSTLFVAGMGAKEANRMLSEMKVFEIEEGRAFKESERGLVVIGSMVVDEVFENIVGIGDSLFIKDKKFKVIGSLKSIGNRQDDQQIYISLDDMRDIVGGKDSLSVVYVKASSPTNVENTAERIKKKLEKKYGEDTYTTMTSEQISERVSSIFAILSFVLGGIASISLVVAGVGIANTMFTSVIERTKEIGVMKAVGATNYNVMEIFLVESALLGFFGGVVGCIIGIILSQIITIVAGEMFLISFEATVTTEMIILSLIFSIVVGIVSGIWPARRAAKLQPVEALRYE